VPLKTYSIDLLFTLDYTCAMRKEGGRNPLLKRAVYFWQSEGQASITRDVTKRTLHEGSRPRLRESYLVGNNIEERVDVRFLPTMPTWLDPVGVSAAAADLAPSAFWYNLLLTLPDEPGSLRQDIEAYSSFGHFSQIIAEENSKFMSPIICVALLAVAEGPAFVYREKRPAFANAISNRYTTVADSPEVFFDRLKVLVPNPDEPRESDSLTLIEYLKNYDMFRVEREEGYRKCPARLLTELMVQQWGRQLRTDPDYRERFMGMVTVNS
jgi:hypothetical protein